ncbi:hypothetical protein CQA53_07475 [Helicobacter didelphidarum]|uniref:VWFA domain-containing protein n=1 Tax=Helicobacter didelphidarum TaxID=2040648 RepID=A0A3D8IK11_9HELI|nr:von Willebrand factor type A domain-containing protein [Helicobacter didelphidarum]RDU64901.1 hypothetical protein CQA53_07475 [Helicobacter didelphidarum]
MNTIKFFKQTSLLVCNVSLAFILVACGNTNNTDAKTDTPSTQEVATHDDILELDESNIHGVPGIIKEPLHEKTNNMDSNMRSYEKDSAVHMEYAKKMSRDSMYAKPNSIVRYTQAYTKNIDSEFVAKGEFNTNSFDNIEENIYKDAASMPLSTFSSDVDTASYAMVRKMLDSGTMPQKDMVRIEELINNFTYKYKSPSKDSEDAVRINTAFGTPFWDTSHRILRIGIKAKDIDYSKRKPSNLVFLIDTSGSMDSSDKLPLVQKSFNLLVENLNENDKVSIVTYAGNAGVALEPTNNKAKILNAINNLHASGGTHGSEGIETAYKLAQKHFIKGGNNRIILATDGDFNVGTTSQGALVDLIKQKAKGGVYLTILGFGYGNYKDSTLENLSNKGNGNYAYIDNILEAKKYLVEQIGATLFTVAKDVKIQVEFNPAKVKLYRLIGYENRILNNEDFNDDKKDAGEMGAGHNVTALYEIIPTDSSDFKGSVPKIDELKYSKNVANGKYSDEWATIKVRYKEPKNDNKSDEKSVLIEQAITDADFTKELDADTKFASAVASFGMLLRNSEHKGDTSYQKILKILSDKEMISDEYRGEFVGLVSKASRLSK